MNLQDLTPSVTSKQIANLLRAQFGKKYDLSGLSLKESKELLSRSSKALNKYREVKNLHESQNDPAYVKLLMLKEAAEKRIQEHQESKMKNSYVQALKKVASGGRLSESEIRRLKVSKGLRGILESKQQSLAFIKRIVENKRAKGRQLNEAEIDSAQVVLAAQDIADQVQQMVEKFADIQYKELPALTDGIRKEMGVEQADAFNQSVLGTLQEVTGSLEAAKAELNTAIAGLTGEEIGQDLDMGNMGDELDVDMDADMGMGDDADLGLDEPAADPGEFELDLDAEEDEELADLGRERR
jgi:urease gamma subunit